MLKKENGITLIALVITIIILLILAGVTLATALGQNGLFIRAKSAANQWENSADQESRTINTYIDEYEQAYNDFVATPGEP